MLDEIYEYEQYTFDIKTEANDYKLRLKYVPLKNGLSGVPRAMLVIARYILFEGLEDSTKFCGLEDAKQKDRIACAKAGLQMWVGDHEDGVKYQCPSFISDTAVAAESRELIGETASADFSSGRSPLNAAAQGKDSNSADGYPASWTERQRVWAQEHRYLQDWFPDYLNLLMSRKYLELWEKKKKNLELWKKKKKKKNPDDEYEKELKSLNDGYKKILGILNSKINGSSSFSNSIFEKESAKKNDYHLTTYDRVIARALRQGPLRQYYLAAEKNILEDDPSGVRKRSDKKESEQDLLLKLTAAWLLEDDRVRRHLDGNDMGWGLTADRANPDHPEMPDSYAYRRINITDLINWCKRDGKIEKDNLKALEYYEKPVFEKITMDNVVKIRPRKQSGDIPNYIDYCGWHLVEYKEYDAVREAHPKWIFYKDQGSGQPFRIL